MTQNKIVIPADEIQDDMFEWAARAQVKTFTIQSLHVPFLQGMCEAGTVETVVKTLGGEVVDNRVFGSSRANHCEKNNWLKKSSESDANRITRRFPLRSKGKCHR